MSLNYFQQFQELVNEIIKDEEEEPINLPFPVTRLPSCWVPRSLPNYHPYSSYSRPDVSHSSSNYSPASTPTSSPISHRKFSEIPDLRLDDKPD